MRKKVILSLIAMICCVFFCTIGYSQTTNFTLALPTLTKIEPTLIAAPVVTAEPVLTAVAEVSDQPVITAVTPALIRMTLRFDWNRDGIYGSTTIRFNAANMTFTTGDGASGDFELEGECLALIFHTGCCPLYSGEFYGFMDCREGNCERRPGLWYLLERPTEVEALDAISQATVAAAVGLASDGS